MTGASATATITGVSISESTGIPTSITEDIVFTTPASYQSLGKWLSVSSVAFTGTSAINYDITNLGYVDFLNTNVNITGYRFEALGASSAGGDADITLELITVSQSGATTTIGTIEDIEVDGNGGANSTGLITDTQRSTRGYTMPAGGDLWPTDSNFVFKQTDFDTYFTSDQNVINGASNGGLIIKLISTAFGGNNGPRYGTITIYYNEV